MLHLVLGCVVAGTALTGCGSEPSPPVGEPATGRPPTSTMPGVSTSPDDSDTGDGGQDGQDGQSGGPGSGAASDSTDASTPQAPASSAGDEPEPGSKDDGTGRGLEMPQAPGDEVESLSELFDAVSDAPLVRAPLPGAASARGRIVAGYPVALRPTRSTRVESSSVSPSGDRLQVALVGSTRLSVEQVLVAYRTRLADRGLVERETPATNAGSYAAAFQRGDSVVTVTVTPQDGRTTYSVQGTLDAGRS